MRWAERDSAGGMAQASRARKEEKQVASKELKVVLCGRAEPAQVRKWTGRRRKLPPGERCLSKVLESMLGVWFQNWPIHKWSTLGGGLSPLPHAGRLDRKGHATCPQRPSARQCAAAEPALVPRRKALHGLPVAQCCAA